MGHWKTETEVHWIGQHVKPDKVLPGRHRRVLFNMEKAQSGQPSAIPL